MRHSFKIVAILLLLCATGCGTPSSSSFEEQVTAAEAHLGLGNPKAALADYRAIARHVRGDPRRAEILLRIADLEATVLGDPARAIVAYGETIDERPLAATAQIARERRAALREERGDFEGAIEDYAALLKYFPNDSNRYRYQVLLAGVYLSGRNYRQARLEVKPLIELPTTPAEVREQALFIAAESFFLEGKGGRAIEYYEWFLHDFPQSSLAAEAKLHLATCFEEQGQLGAAQELMRSASKEYPNQKAVNARLKSLTDRDANAAPAAKGAAKAGAAGR
jgi:tetratricopeptide (TPR) repeat protein